jgi:hypothetical protein
MTDTYNANETLADTEKSVWDAVKAKTKVFITKDLKKNELPKIKGGGTYTQDAKYPAAGLNQPAAGVGAFKRWVLVEK